MGLSDLLPKHWKLYGVAALALGAAFSGWKVRDWQCKAAETAALKSQITQTTRAAAAVNAVAATYETQRQEIRYAAAKDRIVLRTIYRDLPVVSSCAAPDAAVELLDRAVHRANAAATGQPVAELSDAAAAAAPAQ